MLKMLTDYQIWVSLLTLTALEIVLGIDNLIFLLIVSGRGWQLRRRAPRPPVYAVFRRCHARPAPVGHQIPPARFMRRPWTQWQVTTAAA